MRSTARIGIALALATRGAAPRPPSRRWPAAGPARTVDAERAARHRARVRRRRRPAERPHLDPRPGRADRPLVAISQSGARSPSTCAAYPAPRASLGQMSADGTSITGTLAQSGLHRAVRVPAAATPRAAPERRRGTATPPRGRPRRPASRACGHRRTGRARGRRSAASPGRGPAGRQALRRRRRPRRAGSTPPTVPPPAAADAARARGADAATPVPPPPAPPPAADPSGTTRRASGARRRRRRRSRRAPSTAPPAPTPAPPAPRRRPERAGRRAPPPATGRARSRCPRASPVAIALDLYADAGVLSRRHLDPRTRGCGCSRWRAASGAATRSASSCRGSPATRSSAARSRPDGQLDRRPAHSGRAVVPSSV